MKLKLKQILVHAKITRKSCEENKSENVPGYRTANSQVILNHVG